MDRVIEGFASAMIEADGARVILDGVPSADATVFFTYVVALAHFYNLFIKF